MIKFSVITRHRNEMLNIDHHLKAALSSAGVKDGILTVFCPHTTAAITVNENADPDVCHDWLDELSRLVPAHQPFYRHAEGNSDSHVKASMIGASVQVIVENGEMQLGTWQSVFFCEFDGPRTRNVWLQISV